MLLVKYVTGNIFCTEVVFVTTDEQIAIDYCKENNQRGELPNP